MKTRKLEKAVSGQTSGTVSRQFLDIFLQNYTKHILKYIK